MQPWNPYRPYLDTVEEDPLSPFIREEAAPQMPPPDVEIPDPYAQDAPQAPPVYPNNILPFQNLPSPAADALSQHAQDMPDVADKQYDPKLWETIAGGLATGAMAFGGNQSGANAMIAHMGSRPRFREAQASWEDKGKALNAAATVEGKTLGESVDYHLGQIKDATAREGLTTRLKQIENNYKIGMKNAVSAEQRAAVLKAAQAETAAYHKELVGLGKGRVAAETEQAHAATTRAGASVTAANASADRAKKGTAVRPLSSVDSLRTKNAAWNVVESEMPEATEFIEKDENGRIIGWKEAPGDPWGPDLGRSAGWSPEQQIRRNKVIKRFNEIRQEELDVLNSRHITEEPGLVIPE